MWPRHFAIAFLKAGEDREKQKQALSGCKPEWQKLVTKHIEIMREKNDKSR